jgi:hypothetical protein
MNIKIGKNKMIARQHHFANDIANKVRAKNVT